MSWYRDEQEMEENSRMEQDRMRDMEHEEELCSELEEQAEIDRVYRQLRWELDDRMGW